MKKFLLSGIALAAFVAGPALAADLPPRPAPMPYKAPPVITYYSWTGCFIGGNGGGIWANKNWTVGAGDPSIGVAGITAGSAFGSHSISSGIGGAQIGCDYQFAGNWVIGIQADYDWMNGRGSGTDAVNTAFFGVPGYTDQSNISNLGSVTGRLGYAFDRFLGYVRGGVAWERDNYAIFNPAGLGLATASETRTGWTVGIGGEYAFTNWISAFAEYDYYDFGTKNNRMLTGTGVLFDSVDIRERQSVFKVGLNLRWNPGPVVARY
jgi:outer membrane immunogenic protein